MSFQVLERLFLGGFQPVEHRVGGHFVRVAKAGIGQLLIHRLPRERPVDVAQDLRLLERVIVAENALDEAFGLVCGRGAGQCAVQLALDRLLTAHGPCRDGALL